MLTVQIDGEGAVTSQPAGIDCPSTCQVDFPETTLVTLTPEGRVVTANDPNRARQGILEAAIAIGKQASAS